MKDEFYLYLDTLPRTTSQEKGVFVVKGRPIFYEKEEVKKEWFSNLALWEMFQKRFNILHSTSR